MRTLLLSLLFAAAASAQTPHPNLPDANTIGTFRWDPTGTPLGKQPGQCGGNTNRGSNKGFPRWIFDTNNSKGYDAPDQTYWFGLNCDTPIAGSWDGTKHLRVGTFWNGFWYADVNENHAWDAADLV